MARYTIGIDFGSLSARGLLVDVTTGKTEAEQICEYPNGIIDRHWNGSRLPAGVYLQIPTDYIHALSCCVKGLIAQTGVSPKDIIAVGIDGTSATVIPTQKDGSPLCCNEIYGKSPFAQALMWKSHSTYTEVEDILYAGQLYCEPFLDCTGETLPSNGGLPKILHLLRSAPAVFEATHRYYDLCDFIVHVLTGEDILNKASAEGKFYWNAKSGWPSEEFFAHLDKRMVAFPQKMPHRICGADEIAGVVTKEAAKLTGLLPGTPVAVGLNDGISPLAATGTISQGKWMLVIGTSVASILLSDRYRSIKGIYGLLDSAPFNHLFTYETGLQSFGDTLEWMVENCCPATIKQEYTSKSDALNLLSKKAAVLEPGESGLLVMNWWNGNRSVLMDGSLTGCIFGMTLQTKPEELFRAMIEGMAFNFRMIKDEFYKNGINISEIIAVGGIPRKNPFIMQLIADVMGCKITVPVGKQIPALGSAIFAAAAVGTELGGYSTIQEATRKMAVAEHEEYLPNLQNTNRYMELYDIYVDACDYLACSQESPIRRLRHLKKRSYSTY